MLLMHQNTGKENRYRIFFWPYLSVYWEGLIEQIKKNLSYTLEETGYCLVYCLFIGNMAGKKSFEE